MPNAIGKSKVGPSFFTSAGARLMVVRPIGNLKPELLRAVVTRSRDSFTAASGSPTMTISVSPQPALTSTSTGYASMPLSAAEQTLANMGKLWSNRARTSIWFFVLHGNGWLVVGDFEDEDEDENDLGRRDDFEGDGRQGAQRHPLVVVSLRLGRAGLLRPGRKAVDDQVAL